MSWSLCRHERTNKDVKMSQKTCKTWCLRLLPVVLLFVSFVTYYYSYTVLLSSDVTGKLLNSSKSLCGGWLTEKKWESLNFNISRQTQLFLRLQDFFWKDHLSKQALPYGIKGSEEQLLVQVLAVTANDQMPANLENLECRTCVVVGNGFIIKNSSLGSVINKYDVVIRLNDAPVRSYEDDVGSKTTMRFFYPESASSDPGVHNEPGTLMVLVPFKQQDLRWLKEILYDEKRVQDMCENPLCLTQKHTRTHFVVPPQHKRAAFGFFSDRSSISRQTFKRFSFTPSELSVVSIRHSAAPATSGLPPLIVAWSLPTNLHIDLAASRQEGVAGSVASPLHKQTPSTKEKICHFVLCTPMQSPALISFFFLPLFCVICAIQVRKGFWKPPPQIWSGDVSKVRVLDPHFLHQTAEKLLRIPFQPKGKQSPVHPTTGLLAVFVALNYCDVVHIAGFGYPNSKNPRQPIHYYGQDTMKSMKNSYHDLNHEAEALKRLQDLGAILYLHP